MGLGVMYMPAHVVGDSANIDISICRTGACCIVRTVLNFQSIPADYTYGGIDNWYWRLFEVQLGIIAACIPALRPGYKWTQAKIHSYISSRRSSNTRFAKKKPPMQHLEEAKTAGHLKAHPANVYSDPPLLVRSGGSETTTTVGSLGSGDLPYPPKAKIYTSMQIDVESQREWGSQGVMEEKEGVERKPSLDVDLRPRFSLDRVDQSLERIDPGLLRTIDDARREQREKT